MLPLKWTQVPSHCATRDTPLPARGWRQIVTSLRSRRLEVVGEREKGRARGRHARVDMRPSHAHVFSSAHYFQAPVACDHALSLCNFFPSRAKEAKKQKKKITPDLRLKRLLRRL